MPEGTGRVLELTLLKHQAASLTDRTSDTQIVVCGYGGGKTEGVVYKALDAAAINGAGIPTYVVEPTFPMVRKILIPAFEKVLDEHDILWRYNKNEHLLGVRIGGQWCPIQLESSEHPERLKGPNIGVAIIDEAGLHKPDVWRHLPPRCRHPKARLRQFVAVGTPEGLEDFYDWAEGEWDESKRGVRNVIRAQTLDNVFLPGGPEEYIRTKLSHLDEADLDQYVRGLFVAKGSRVYRSFNRENMGGPCPVDAIRGQRLYVGADFNVGKMVWIIGVQRGFDGFHVIGEVVTRDTTVEQHVPVFMQYLRRRLHQIGDLASMDEIRSRVVVHVDPSAKNRDVRAPKSVVEYLRGDPRHHGAGFQVWCNQAPIDVADRVMTVNSRFRLGHLLVDVAECPELMRTLEKQGRDRSGAPEKHDDPERDLSAGGDALGYALWGFPHWRATVPRGNLENRQPTGYVG